METAVIVFLCGAVVTLVGWLIVPRITDSLAACRERKAREHSAANATEARKRQFRAAISAVRDGFNTTSDEKLVGAHEASTTRVRDECAAFVNDLADEKRIGFQTSRDAYLSLTRDQIECRDWNKKVPLATPPARYHLGRARLRQLLGELIEYAN